MNEQPSVDRRTVARLTLASVAVCAIAATACQEAEPDFGGQLAVRDSVGVEIVGTDGQQARAVSQITVQNEPELQIGEFDGDLAYTFLYISGVALLPGSRILILDDSRELRFYDLQGELVSRLGGRGQGPGEFERPPRLLNMIAGDSIVIYDPGNRRFTLYPADGDGFRSFPRPRRLPGSMRGTSGAQVVLTAAGAGELPSRDAQGPIPSATNVRLVDFALETSETIASTSYTMVATPNPFAGVPSLTGAPFTFPTAVAANRNGFFITTPHEPSVLEYSWTGELRRIVRLSEPRNGVTDAEFRTAIDRRVDRMVEGAGSASVERAIRRAFDDLEPPEFEPTFQSLVVDDEGWLWAQTYQESPDDNVTWLVFDIEGRGRGSVALPGSLALGGSSRADVAAPERAVESGQWCASACSGAIGDVAQSRYSPGRSGAG